MFLNNLIEYWEEILIVIIICIVILSGMWREWKGTSNPDGE